MKTFQEIISIKESLDYIKNNDIKFPYSVADHLCDCIVKINSVMNDMTEKDKLDNKQFQVNFQNYKLINELKSISLNLEQMSHLKNIFS